MHARKVRGLGRSEPQLARTRPVAKAEGAPRVAFVGFYGPVRTVWDVLRSGRRPCRCSRTPPLRSRGSGGGAPRSGARPLTLYMLAQLSSRSCVA